MCRWRIVDDFEHCHYMLLSLVWGKRDILTLLKDVVHLLKQLEIKLRIREISTTTGSGIQYCFISGEGREDIRANERIKDAINQTGKIYISGTTWNNEGALRIAVCNHLTPPNAQEEATQILTILENAYNTIS